MSDQSQDRPLPVRDLSLANGAALDEHAATAQPGPAWNPDQDPLGSTDESGRHAVPTEQGSGGLPDSSYSTFFEDPPYVRDEDVVDGLNTVVQVSPAPRYADPAVPTYGGAIVPGPPPVPLPEQPRDTVTCPECGATQAVQLARREAADFCRRCDFPLFWVPSRITRDVGVHDGSESLRRLPGTRGRSTLASKSCPHCAELNSVAAEVCVRCGLSMRIDAPPPPPPPQPPPPAPEPEPYVEPGVALWVWLLLALGAVAIISVIVLGATGVIG